MFQELEDILSKERCDIREMDVKKDPEGGPMRVRVQITTPRDFDHSRLVEAITSHVSVTGAKIC